MLWLDSILRDGWQTRRALSRLVLFCVLPAVVVIAIRVWIRPVDAAAQLRVVLDALGFMRYADFWMRMPIALFSGLGVLPLLLLTRPRAILEMLRRESLWLLLLLAGAALLFGGVDKARLFTYMLPAVVVLCVRTLAAGHPRVTLPIAAWLVVMLGLHLFLGYYLTPMGNVTEYLGRMVPMHGPYDAVRPGLIRVAAVTGAWLLATWLILPRTAPTT